MPRGRTTGALNIQQYKYCLVLPNGNVEYFTSQNAVLEKVDVNRTKLNRIINHPELVQNCDIVCKRLEPPLPAFRKIELGKRQIKYVPIVYDTKGNDVETEIQPKVQVQQGTAP